jgi:hypothetical protein
VIAQGLVLVPRGSVGFSQAQGFGFQDIPLPLQILQGDFLDMQYAVFDPRQQAVFFGFQVSRQGMYERKHRHPPTTRPSSAEVPPADIGLALAFPAGAGRFRANIAFRQRWHGLERDEEFAQRPFVSKTDRQNFDNQTIRRPTD